LSIARAGARWIPFLSASLRTAVSRQGTTGAVLAGGCPFSPYQAMYT
jgi:hypothetical protein